jgi:site-specific recombinase XerD
MPFDWKNPIRKVKAPRLPVKPIEPISLQDIQSLLKTCEQRFSGSRDKALIFGLLDTGARAHEFLNLYLEDVELASGSVLIRQGKNRKPRMVFLGRKTKGNTRQCRKRQYLYDDVLHQGTVSEHLKQVTPTKRYHEQGT